MALGAFVAVYPGHAARIWGSEKLDKLAPSKRATFLRWYRVLSVLLCLGGILSAVESIAFPNDQRKPYTERGLRNAPGSEHETLAGGRSLQSRVFVLSQRARWAPRRPPGRPRKRRAANMRSRCLQNRHPIYVDCALAGCRHELGELLVQLPTPSAESRQNRGPQPMQPYAVTARFT
jgi:hypothetical protein